MVVTNTQKRSIFNHLRGTNCWRARFNECRLSLSQAKGILGDHPVEELAKAIKESVIDRHSAGADVQFDISEQSFIVSSRGPI